ncbi:MAG: TldD/PmbA family protein [Deltaproteobacteria bacterium]|jgi:PmbA protein|nr:TldD/PmbA family protein [Deltaproteobacteria bacterium]MBT6434530.1 TldD/PmbA family protein [Deltaproteobacteria bacterium]MBT6488124.1 TldD/PmbA family protein [Deltaproteobacteria bacterium]
MSSTNREILDSVIKIAKDKNVDADVILTQEEQLGLKADRGELSEYKVTSSRCVGIRVVQGDQVGTSYSESVEPSSLETMVQTAIENAGYAKEDPNEKICANDQKIADWSSRTCLEDEATVEEKVALTLALESGLEGRDIPAKAPYNAFSEINYEISMANTLGHTCSHQERQVSCYTYALLDQEGQQSMHLGYEVGRQFQELSAQRVTDEAYETAKDLLTGTPVSTGAYEVVFTTDCLNDLLSAFGMCWSGQSAMKGLNPLREKIGETIAHSEFSLFDDPSVDGGFALQAFDSEGFATVRTPIVEAGKLSTFLHNSATANFFGTANTANAARGTKSALSVSPSHLCIGTGSQTEKDLKSGTYLELVSLQGVHSGANAISGDFSFGASGFLHENGERKQAVRGVTVAGNFYKMLQEISAIGDTTHSDHSRSFFAPLIRFDKLSVAGA